MAERISRMNGCSQVQLAPDTFAWAMAVGVVEVRADGSWYLTDLGRKDALRAVDEHQHRKLAEPEALSGRQGTGSL